MSYVIYTSISAFFLALYDLFKKLSVKNKSSVYEILFFYNFIAFICSCFFIKEVFSINVLSLIYILIKSIIISLSWFFTMKAISKLQLGIVVPFSLLGSVFTTILAFFFLGEEIGFTQIGGIITILVGLLLIARLCRKDEDCKNDYKYLGLLVLSAFLSSISAIIDRCLLSSTSRGSIVFLFFLFLSLIYFVICLVKNKKVNFLSLKSNLWIVGIGLSIFLSDLFYYLAVSYDSASLSMISIIRKLSVFIGVVMAGIFLNENKLCYKVLIMLLMFCGLSFITFL